MNLSWLVEIGEIVMLGGFMCMMISLPKITKYAMIIGGILVIIGVGVGA